MFPWLKLHAAMKKDDASGYCRLTFENLNPTRPLGSGIFAPGRCVAVSYRIALG